MEQNSEKNIKFQEFMKKFQALLDEYNVRPEMHLTFPDYKNLPTDLQLALSVVNKHRNEFVLNFKEKEQ